MTDRSKTDCCMTLLVSVGEINDDEAQSKGLCGVGIELDHAASLRNGGADVGAATPLGSSAGCPERATQVGQRRRRGEVLDFRLGEEKALDEADAERA